MGALFAATVVPETKNKTLADIQLKLVGKYAPREVVPPAVTITMHQVAAAVTETST